MPTDLVHHIPAATVAAAATVGGSMNAKRRRLKHHKAVATSANARRCRGQLHSAAEKGACAEHPTLRPEDCCGTAGCPHLRGTTCLARTTGLAAAAVQLGCRGEVARCRHPSMITAAEVVVVVVVVVAMVPWTALWRTTNSKPRSEGDPALTAGSTRTAATKGTPTVVALRLARKR